MSPALIEVAQNGVWLEARLPEPMRVLSWAPFRPGFQVASRVAWREVRNADLPDGFDAEGWLARECRSNGYADAVGLLTSRSVAHHDLVVADVGRASAACLATVGLSNAERVGERTSGGVGTVGTINIAVALNLPLTRAAQVEALSLVASARTAAVLEIARLDQPHGRATGTGTDCIALACPEIVPAKQPDVRPEAYAGMHTEVGAAIGQAVYGAVAAGIRRWTAEFGLDTAEHPGAATVA